MDVVVVGEGEQTLLELLPLLLDGEPVTERLRQIAGLAYLDADGQFVVTTRPPHTAPTSTACPCPPAT